MRKKAIKTKIKVWTVLCIIFVCAIAIFLRGSYIYKAYPLEYKDIISKYSAEYDIDEYLVCAVISAESGFNETALSPRGAMGLMQIMPDTGSWVAEKIGLEQIETSMLYDPETNIRIGCWYLDYLNDLFDGEASIVLAAYNAGPARVKEWLDSDGNLSLIPYKETEKYIVKIERNYEIYKSLYKDF